MKILVTGGAGFIGSHLVDLLLKKELWWKPKSNLDQGLKETAEYFKNRLK